MKFSDVVDQASVLLQRKGRVSYRALTREFALDAEALADLKEELIVVLDLELAADKDGQMLVWTGDERPEETTSQPADAPLADSPSLVPSAQPEQKVLSGERRQLIVMFCDLVGSTALSEQLDPEDLQTGDYFANTIGDEPVVVCRGKDRQVRVFLNSCRYRGTQVCRTDTGNTLRFQCPYRGWTYDLQGQLLGHQKEGDGGSFEGVDRKQWGLLQVPRVESYRGLIFACFDEHAESLVSYLGDMTWYLDILLNRTEGGLIALPGVHKWSAPANWKFAAEQFSGDVYHVSAHESLFRMGMLSPTLFMETEPKEGSFHMRTDNAHTWIGVAGLAPPDMLSPELGTYYAGLRKEAGERLNAQQCGLVDATNVGQVYPNLGIVSLLGMLTLRLWQLRGPDRMEIWSWAFVDRDAPPEVVSMSRQIQDRTFSPAGIFEQDDVEMWAGCTTGARGFYRRRFPLNYQTGWCHHQRDATKPGMIDEPLSDRGSFEFYKRWRELMQNGNGR